VALTAQITCFGAATTFTRLDSSPASSAGWVQLTGVLQVPSCDLQTVAVYLEGPEPGVDLLVDDLALREHPLANLITNSGFESGTAGWFGWGPTVLGVTPDAASGDQAAVGTGRTASWNGIATNLSGVVVPGGTYQVGAAAKLRGAITGPLVLTARLLCQGGSSEFRRVASTMGTSAEYSPLGGVLEVPSCPLQDVTLYVEGPPAGVDILLDDVTLWQQPSELGPNVVANAGFESGTQGWFGFGGVSISAATERAHSGTRSGRVTGRTATWNGLATSLLGVATPGRPYQVSGWAALGTGSSNVNLTLQTACSGQATNFTTLASATANDAGWTELQGTLSLPSCELVTATFYIEGAPAGTDIYLDDVSIREQL
jgi:hypothetical protein